MWLLQTMMDEETKANSSFSEEAVVGVHYLDSSPSLFISKQASRVRMPEGQSLSVQKLLDPPLFVPKHSWQADSRSNLAPAKSTESCRAGKHCSMSIVHAQHWRADGTMLNLFT